MTSGIYKILNTKNGEFYIGSSINIAGRWQGHKRLLQRGKSSCRHLQSAWNLYGENVFEFSIIEICPIPSLIIREQYYIDTLLPEYNVAKIAGNCIGIKRTPEAREKMRAAKVGRKLSEAHKAKIGLAGLGHKRNIGRIVSAETRAKLSISLKKALSTPEQRAKNSARNMGNTRALGNKLSEEAKKRISDFQKIFKMLPEQRKLNSERMKGKKNSLGYEYKYDLASREERSAAHRRGWITRRQKKET